MKPIITSMIDDDLYKLNMQNAFLELFPDAVSRHKFINRGKQRFNSDFKDALVEQICSFADLKLTDYEYRWCKSKVSHMKPWYFDWLKGFRYNPDHVKVSLTSDNNLEIDINGKLHEEVLWEVKLMAVISELYFNMIDKNWTMGGQHENARDKAFLLNSHGCNFTDFGTRRRRSFETQNIVVESMKDVPVFMGTSNTLLAMNHSVRPIGTYAHEWVQSNAILESFQYADYYAMHNWNKVFNSKLGIALTDTYGLDSFLKNFNLRFAKLFDGLRHDSGDEFIFVDKVVAHYKKLGVNPLHKFIIFSNGLNCNRATEIQKYCGDKIGAKIGASYGIGTFLTNDFVNSPALNMVIKLSEVNGVPAVKLSDDEGKEIGDPDAVRVMKWMHKGKKL